MKRAVASLVLIVSLGLPALGCGDDDGSGGSSTRQTSEEIGSGETPGGPSEASLSRSRGSAVKVMRTRYGRMLFDGKGRALYLFTRESDAKSRCYGACAAAWPPFLARGKPRARSGVQRSLLGRTTRRNGRRQVTYKGHPLYYYVTDRRPGQVTCQNVAEFGGTWLVVAPSGDPITLPR